MIKLPDNMRRCLSSLLLLLTLMTSVSPLLALTPQTLPACCRVGGKHHCTAVATLGGAGFHAQAPVCPFYRIPAAVRTHTALHSGRAILALALRSTDSTVCVAARPVLRPSYALPQRAPPLA